MNIRTILAVVGGALALSLNAQEREASTRNHFYIGGRLHFNITAELQNLPAGAFTGPGYDDGYVQEDISGNAGGKTWNWGYARTNQIIGATPNRELELHGAPSPRDGSTERMEGDLQYGFELGYGRELWRFGKEDRPIRVGVEGSFAASALSLDANNTVSGTVTRVNDRYLLGSVIAPNPPYAGSFQGPVPPNPPAPLIGTNLLSRTRTQESATAFQHAEIEGTYWGFRIGPFIEAPLPRRFSLLGGFGLTMVHVDADLTYQENFTITGIGGPPEPRTDTQSTSEWLVGFYTQARLNYWINDVMAVYVGGEFQALDDLKMGAANKEATIDFGSTFGVVFGVMYAF